MNPVEPNEFSRWAYRSWVVRDVIEHSTRDRARVKKLWTNVNSRRRVWRGEEVVIHQKNAVILKRIPSLSEVRRACFGWFSRRAVAAVIKPGTCVRMREATMVLRATIQDRFQYSGSPKMAEGCYRTGGGTRAC